MPASTSLTRSGAEDTAGAHAPRGSSAERPGRRVLPWLVMAVVLLVAVVLSISCGSRPIDLASTWRVVPQVFGGDPGAVPGVPPLDGAVVESRVWRTAAGVLTGAALSVAGALLQGATRNPLGLSLIHI